MTSSRITLPQRPRILVITLRRLGDVLLSTPLIRSIKRAWPEATLGRVGVRRHGRHSSGQSGHRSRHHHAPAADVGREHRARSADWSAATTSRFRRRAVTGRLASPSLPRAAASRRSNTASAAVSSVQLLTRSVAYDPRAHRVEAMLRLADTLGIARVPKSCRRRAAVRPGCREAIYAVIHAAPMFNYKRWTAAGWRAVASALSSAGSP